MPQTFLPPIRTSLGHFTWAEDGSQAQLGYRAQVIRSSGIACHVNPEAAQLLKQSPDFGTAGRNFLGDRGAADYDRGMFHQQANDVTEAEINGLGLMRRR